MASYIFDEGRRGVTGAYGWYYFKETLKTGGWSVLGSGDGLSLFSTSTDILTSPGAGAGGMGNTNAWVRLRMPGAVLGVTREFVFQMSDASGSLAATSAYSYAAHFTGGSPSATAVPTATDGATFGTGAFSTNDTYRLYMGCDTQAPYGAWLFPLTNGNGGASAGGFLLDPIEAGSGPLYDKDPYIFWVDTTAGTGWSASNLSNGQSSSRAYFGKGTNEELWAYVSAAVEKETAFSGANGAPGNRGSNIYSLDEQMEAITWGRSTSNTPTAPNNLKGRGTIMKWNSFQAPRGKLATETTTRDRICLGDVNFPHGGGLVIF